MQRGTKARVCAHVVCCQAFPGFTGNLSFHFAQVMTNEIEHRRLAPAPPAVQSQNVAFRPGRGAPLHLALQIINLTPPTVDFVVLPLNSLIVISDPVVFFSFEAGNIGFVIADFATLNWPTLII